MQDVEDVRVDRAHPGDAHRRRVAAPPRRLRRCGLREAAAAARAQVGAGAGRVSEQEHAFEQEKEQEHEHEHEHEQEKQREQEQRAEPEAEAEPEEFVREKYARADDAARAWALSSLSLSPDFASRRSAPSARPTA